MAEPYFIWKNIDSRTMGVVVNSYPPIIRPKERVKETPIPGRPGALNMTEGADIYETYVRSCPCYTRPTADIGAVLAWLRGFGQVTFGNEPTMTYTAKIDNQISLDKILANHPHRSFVVPFICQPFKHQKTPDADIVKTVSGQSITNPGNVASLPIIKVEGSGDIMLTVGGLAVELNDIVGGIIIDCTLPDCFNLDRTALINDRLTGAIEDIRLPVGSSSVHWTGTVTKVTITPNWRWL
jgi:phage-related protein